MKTIIEVISAIHASESGDWVAFVCLPACMLALGALFCGFAR